MATEMATELTPLDVSEGPVVVRHPRPRSRTAWVFLLAHGFLLFSAGLYWTFRGRFFDPKIYEAIGGGTWTLVETVGSDVQNLVAAAVRFAGALATVLGFFVMAVAATAYRTRERWAWYAMCALPVYVSLDFMTLAGYGALSTTSTIWHLSLLGTALLGLVPPYASFFPHASEDEERGMRARR